MAIPTTKLSESLSICKILNGMWQSSGGHGQINRESAIAEMLEYHNLGFTSWDLADIYGPAERFIGDFREKLINIQEIKPFQALTKFVPNPGPMSKSIVEYHISESQKKMKTDVLDMVQFHWWDYADSSYLDALLHMFNLKDKGKIKNIGLTNFDTDHVEIIMDKGFKIISNQVQYSIIDQRPERFLVPFCRNKKISLLTYGTLLGGFLSEKYLKKDKPKKEELSTLSLRKYYDMIQTWGGWELFQDLLEVLDDIARKHTCTIANVATKFILDKPTVAGVIIGTRLGVSQHRENNTNVFSLNLNDDDYSLINSISSKFNNLYEKIGDCGSEYR